MQTFSKPFDQLLYYVEMKEVVNFFGLSQHFGLKNLCFLHSSQALEVIGRSGRLVGKQMRLFSPETDLMVHNYGQTIEKVTTKKVTTALEIVSKKHVNLGSGLDLLKFSEGNRRENKDYL